MNTLLRLMVAALLVEAILISGTFKAGAQAPPNPPILEPIYLGPASKVFFDHSGLDTAGNPSPLKDCEFGLSSPIVVDLNQQPTPTLQAPFVGPVAAGSNAVPLVDLYAASPEGQARFWLRVRDKAGGQTRWIGGVLVEVKRTPPALPTNFRISIDGTASLKVEGEIGTVTLIGKVTREP